MKAPELGGSCCIQYARILGCERNKMITSLSGELIERTNTYAVIECCGVGYLVNISQKTYSGLPEKGPCTLLTHFTVSVDVRSGASEHKLFGFSHKEERTVFRKLISVSGVSSTLGMLILSSMDAAQLQRAVMEGDTKRISTVKGIGPKLAERIIVELRGKLDPLELSTGVGGSGNTVKGEALSAMSSLGVDRIKAERVLQEILKNKGESITLEELIKAALKEL